MGVELWSRPRGSQRARPRDLPSSVTHGGPRVQERMVTVPSLPELGELKVFGLQNPLPPDPTTTAEPTMTEDTDTSWEDETTLFSTSDESTINPVSTTIPPFSTSFSGSTLTLSTESTDSTTSDTTPTSSASSVESISTLSTESIDSTTSDTTPASNESSVESTSTLSTEYIVSTTSDTTPTSSESSVESTSTSKLLKLRDSIESFNSSVATNDVNNYQTQQVGLQSGFMNDSTGRMCRTMCPPPPQPHVPFHLVTFKE
uniref:Uncharacterized protein n=1 Tax=Timema cristinae TaxID=61476 RepID=A0A7R9CEI1_TIMCR|nr:unnamed protein product [Timema cristinae]